MKKILLLLLILSKLTYSSTTIEEYNDLISPYEQNLQEAMDTMTTSSIVSDYFDALNIDVTETYNELLKIQNTSIKKSVLKSSQEEWIKLRDKEYAYIKVLHAQNNGSWSGISQSFDKIEVLKSRIFYLITLFPVEGDI